jgi:hypothetical protein
MKTKIYSSIAIAGILAFALIASMPTTSVSALEYGDKENKKSKDKKGNMTGGNGLDNGQMGGESTNTMGGQ